MRISDWSSDVCSSDLDAQNALKIRCASPRQAPYNNSVNRRRDPGKCEHSCVGRAHGMLDLLAKSESAQLAKTLRVRSEEHTSELQSLMRISYAVFCLKKKSELL